MKSKKERQSEIEKAISEAREIRQQLLANRLVVEKCRERTAAILKKTRALIILSEISLEKRPRKKLTNT